jgi:hypothetical protein
MASYVIPALRLLDHPYYALEVSETTCHTVRAAAVRGKVNIRSPQGYVDCAEDVSPVLRGAATPDRHHCPPFRRTRVDGVGDLRPQCRLTPRRGRQLRPG